MAERILCVLGKLRAGGVESMMYSYYRVLDKSRWQYDFVYEEGSEFDVPAELTAMGAGAYKVPSVSSPHKYIKAMKKLIRGGGYRIVHTNLNTLSLFSLWAAKCCGVKIRILHNHSTSSGVEKKRDIIKKVLRPFNRMLTTHPCACSEYAARWMYGDKAVDGGKIKVFPNGVDTEKFSYDQGFRNEIRREFNIENNTVIGHIGRFNTQKNHKFLIDIFSEYHKIDKNAYLLCVGGGELMDEIKEYANKCGVADRVIFAGYRNADVQKFYSAFDIFVLPSLYEGLPVVAVEACAAGLPVLMSEHVTKEALITDRCEMLSINGENDASVWADHIVAALSENDRAKTAAQMANGCFNIRNSAAELENYYAACAAELDRA